MCRSGCIPVKDWHPSPEQDVGIVKPEEQQCSAETGGSCGAAKNHTNPPERREAARENGYRHRFPVAEHRSDTALRPEGRTTMRGCKLHSKILRERRPQKQNRMQVNVRAVACRRSMTRTATELAERAESLPAQLSDVRQNCNKELLHIIYKHSL